MNYRRFYRAITIRTLLIGLTSIALIWSINQDYMPVTFIAFIVLWTLQIYLLVRYLGKFLSDVTRFFEALQFRDVSPTFTTSNRDLQPLYGQMERLMLNFRLVRREKEEERLLREVALDQASAGIALINSDNFVTFANPEALRLMGSRGLSSIAEMPSTINAFLENQYSHDKKLLSLMIDGTLHNIAVRKTMLTVGDKSVKLLSLQDIQSEVEQTEIDAWRKLIRVLTHEMVNSVKPISILTHELLNIWNNKADQIIPNRVTKEELNELTEALTAINSRSESLNNFIQNFRNLTLPTQPSRQLVNMNELTQLVGILFAPTFSEYNATLTINVDPPDLTMSADPKLLEQLLIILLRNALEAHCSGRQKEISIESFNREDEVLIVVSDNGDGIPIDVAEQMFTPFFTTKPNGSGVGLSLALQIAKLHKGSINAQCHNGKTKITVALKRI